MPNIHDVLLEIADNFGDEGVDSIRYEYSGRFMYGDTCVGIVTDYPDKVVKAMESLNITGANFDSMARSTIVFWKQFNKNNIDTIQTDDL